MILVGKVMRRRTMIMNDDTPLGHSQKHGTALVIAMRAEDMFYVII